MIDIRRFIIVCFCCIIVLHAEIVDQKSWAEFHLGEADSPANPIEGTGADLTHRSDCPIESKCRVLRRVVVSCDLELATTGCGVCMTGFQEVVAPGGDVAPRTQCIKVSTASLGTDEDNLIDSLSASDPAHDTLYVALRADPAAPELANGTAGVTTAAVSPPYAAPPRRQPVNGDFVFYLIVGTTTGLGLIFIIICAVCWFKYNAVAKQADDEFVETEFTTQANGHPGDGKLALSAQMYHYQHQKQQMIALEKSNGDSKHGASDVDSDLENEDSDLTTVYECPGLAPTGEMEVRNPFFREEFDNATETTARGGPPAM